MNIAVYPGSFDPFTYGHSQIAIEASKIFDKLIIVKANNSDKKYMFDPIMIKEKINEYYKTLKITNIEAIVSDKLIVDVCEDYGAKYIVKGLRNPNDFMYEETMAKVNSKLNPSIETIYLRTHNEYISSTFIKELLRNNKDISQYVPYPISKFIKEK